MKIIESRDRRGHRRVAADNAAAVRRKYEARARRAARAGRAFPIRKRLEAIAGFRERVVATQEKLARTLTQEVGKPIRQSRNELTGLLGRIDFFLEASARALREEKVFADGKKMDERITHEPLGVDRQHLGVELPLLRRQQRVRAGARRRQRRAVQAVGVRDADRALRSPKCCTSRAFRATCSFRSSATARPARRSLASRSTASSSPARMQPAREIAASRRPADDQGPARARRQGSGLRLRRRAT